MLYFPEGTYLMVPPAASNPFSVTSGMSPVETQLLGTGYQADAGQAGVWHITGHLMRVPPTQTEDGDVVAYAVDLRWLYDDGTLVRIDNNTGRIDDLDLDTANTIETRGAVQSPATAGDITSLTGTILIGTSA